MYDELKTMYEVEQQLNKEDERSRKEELNKKFKEASSSGSMEAFNSVMGTLAGIIAVVFCLSYLWSAGEGGNHFLFFLVVFLIAASFVARNLSKRYFFKGDYKKFKLFNKIAGVTGVSTAVFELQDTHKGRSRGAVDKFESMESSIRSTLKTVSSLRYNCTAYRDSKYDNVRDRAYGMGKYMYGDMCDDKLAKLIKDVHDKEESVSLSSDSEIRLHVLCKYVYDVINLNYKVEEDNNNLLYMALGALHFFLHPLTDIPDFIPLAGSQDNMFVIFCVYATNHEMLNSYRRWMVDYVRATYEKECPEDMEVIWSRIVEEGESQVKTGRMYDLILAVDRKLRDPLQISQGDHEYYSDLMHLIDDVSHSRYELPDISSYYGAVGAVSYFVNPMDDIPDYLEHGYVDDLIVLHCCVSKLKGELDTYMKWRGLNILLEENDPLTDYLNTVIGTDSVDRQIEVNRLSKLCQDDTLTDVNDRARAALAALT